jgi:hypothetical protein
MVECRMRDAAADCHFEPARSGHVLGMVMAVERIDDLQSKLAEFLKIALSGWQHRIDQDRPARLRLM